MRGIRLFHYVILTICGLTSIEASSQVISWSPVRGPYSGTVQLITIDPAGDVFAMLSPGGIYRSTDDGRTWNAMNSALNFTYEPVLISDATENMYAGSASSGLFESTDRGVSWIKTSLQGSASAAAIISGNKLCVGGTQTVSISNDTGKSWSTYQVRTDAGDVSSLAEDSLGNIFAGFYYRGIGTHTYGGGIMLLPTAV